MLAAFVMNSTAGKDAVKIKNVDLAEELEKLRHELERVKEDTKAIIAREDKKLTRENEKMRRQDDELRDQNNTLELQNVVRNSFDLRQMDLNSELEKLINKEIKENVHPRVTLSCSTRNTPCALGGGKWYKLQFLDRQRVACSANEVLQSFRFVRCTTDTAKYEFKCCTFKVSV